MKSILNLTKKEVLEKIKEYEELCKYYYFDGSPKVKEVGVTDIELIENNYFDDKQIKIVEEWIKTLKEFVDVNEWDFKHIEVDDNEIKRLAEMLDGKVDNEFTVSYITMPDGKDISVDISEDDESDNFELSFDWLGRTCGEENINVTFTGTFVYEELRKL